jgi:L-histidine N-alpha-methyltransferase
MSSDDSLLLGTDLVKDRGRLVAAYDDAAGVTADFNRNVLRVLNQQLGADFDPELFRHVALWNEDEQWIEMRLRANADTEVSLAGAGITVRFQEGEDLLTEISAKFTPERVERELIDAGFVVEGMWGADEGEFLLTLAHPYC